MISRVEMAEEKVIHDPIHGSIRISGLVLELLDTPEVQRLRGIKQLGLANLVFPGANHARFEHVLGAAHLVEKLGNSLGVEEDELNLLRAAAVLHDIGHPAFSHTLESLMEDYLGKNHMEMAKDLLEGQEGLSEEERAEVKRLRIPSAPEVLSKHGVNASEVAKLVLGEHKKPYLGQIIHGDIDVDQMDYLLRDGHFTGVALGMVDVDRLMRTFIIRGGNLAVESKGIEAVEGFLTARALMFTSVYFHHTVRIAELMLANAVEFALREGKTLTQRNFHRLTDAELLHGLWAAGGYPRTIVARLRYRRLFKTAYVEGRRELSRAQRRELIKKYGSWSKIKSIQAQLASEAGVQEGEVILDVPVVEVLLSEPRLEKVEVRALAGNKLVRLSKLSAIAGALKKRQAPRYLLRVIAPPEHVERVRKHAKQVLG